MEARRMSFLILLFSVVLLTGLFVSCSTDVEVNSLPPLGFIYRQGDQLLLDGDPIMLRGVCFANYFWEESDDSYKHHHSEVDYERLRSMKMNVVRFYMMPSMFEDPQKPYVYPDEKFRWLDENIQWARKNGIYLILDMHGPQGGYQSDGDGLALWDNPENQKRKCLPCI